MSITSLPHLRVRFLSGDWTEIPAIKAAVMLLLILAAAFCTVGAMIVLLFLWVGFETLQTRAEKGGSAVRTFLRCGRPYLRDVALLGASLLIAIFLHPAAGFVPEQGTSASIIEAVRGIAMTILETLVLMHVWQSAQKHREAGSRKRWTKGERVLGMIGVGLLLLALIVGAVVPLPFVQGAWAQVLKSQLMPWKV